MRHISNAAGQTASGPKDFTCIQLLPDGDRVIVTYEGQVKGGRGFQNTAILTFRDAQIIEAEVYFGWSLPHEAKAGGYIDRH